MKRAISLSFLLLVNMIILAHAVIPHHHHAGEIHVVTAHHEHDGNLPDRHHSDDTHRFWLLTMVKVRLGNDKQINQSNDFDFAIDLLPCFLPLFSDDTILPIKDDVGLLFAYHPYLQSCHIEFISQSLGLRAPPVC